jgi:hypothetical protein
MVTSHRQFSILSKTLADLQSSHCHRLTINTLIQILSKKQIDATAKKKYDKPKMSGTLDVGLAKFGTTPGGGASPGICINA